MISKKEVITPSEYLFTQLDIPFSESNVLFADFLDSVSRLRVIKYTQRGAMCLSFYKGAWNMFKFYNMVHGV
jgi:hypothetical protein